MDSGENNHDVSRIVDGVIKSRQTKKILGDTNLNWDHPLDRSDEARSAFDQLVSESIEAAGWAPFHHSRKSMDVLGEKVIHEPWRFYRLDRRSCVKLLANLDDIAPPGIKIGKLPGYLAATGTLVLVTWLPESIEESDDHKTHLRNDEHLAAASAAVQNLLLAANARELETYWNSGGLLREGSVFEFLGIPATEKLLAAVLIAPSLVEYDGAVNPNPGKLRDLRSGPDRWCRSITVD